MANNFLNYENLKLVVLGAFLLTLYFGFTHEHVLVSRPRPKLRYNRHSSEGLASHTRPPSGPTEFYGLSQDVDKRMKN